MSKLKVRGEKTYVGSFGRHNDRIVVPRINLQHLEIAADSDLLDIPVALIQHLVLPLDEIVRELLTATSPIGCSIVALHLAIHFIILGFLGQC